jgi:hypothetical protein
MEARRQIPGRGEEAAGVTGGCAFSSYDGRHVSSILA